MHGRREGRRKETGEEVERLEKNTVERKGEKKKCSGGDKYWESARKGETFEKYKKNRLV